MSKFRIFFVIYIYFLLKFNIYYCSKSLARDDGENVFLITGGYYPKGPFIDKYLVSIRHAKYHKYFGDDHICGGALISTTTVLTAAHCISGITSPKDLSVVIGTRNRLKFTSTTQRIGVIDIRVHSKFDMQSSLYDIAIIKLQRKVKVDGVKIGIAKLPKETIPAYTVCTVAGWGRLYENGPLADTSMYSDLAILDEAACGNLLEHIICAGDVNDSEKDACVGDSGGPLICKGVLAGLVSFGFGCAQPYQYGIYTNVYDFLDWIEKNASIPTSFYQILYVLVIFVLLQIICIYI